MICDNMDCVASTECIAARRRRYCRAVAALVGSALVWATCWHATTWFWVRVIGWRAW